MTSGFSGFMLLTSVSTGIVAGEGGRVVLSRLRIRLCIGIFEFGGMNLSG